MFSPKLRGSERVQGADPQAIAGALATVFRGVGFDVRLNGNVLSLSNRQSTFFSPRSLAAIDRAEITIASEIGEIRARYVISLHPLFFLPVMLFPAILGVAFTLQHRFVLAGVLGGLAFGAGICWIGGVGAQIGFEDWIQHGSRASDPAAGTAVVEQYKRSSLKWQTAIVLVSPIMVIFVTLTFALQTRAENRARAILRNQLSQLPPHATVVVGGHSLPNSDLFLQLLSGVHHVDAHHSGPTRKLRVTISSSQQSLEFFVGQDSERPDEFWIIRDDQEAGRISDPRLRTVLSTVAPDVR